MSEELLALFRATGALLDGHFVLRSGLPSRQFFATHGQERPASSEMSYLCEEVRWTGLAPWVHNFA
jgi:hypothetical protein